jgi:methyl-accepting chemotaxis protein
LSDKKIDKVAARIINTGCDRDKNLYEREETMKNRSLNFKLLAGGSLCVLLPLLAFAIFSDRQLSKDLMATNEQNVSNIAKSLSGLTQMVLQEEIKIARDLSVGNTTIEVAAKVAEAGSADSSADIQRLEHKLATC